MASTKHPSEIFHKRIFPLKMACIFLGHFDAMRNSSLLYPLTWKTSPYASSLEISEEKP